MPLTFRATCAVCLGWLGPRRPVANQAVRDFDDHAATVAHVEAMGDPEHCGSCGHPVDDHDLREQDGCRGCSRCIDAGLVPSRVLASRIDFWGEGRAM